MKQTGPFERKRQNDFETSENKKRFFEVRSFLDTFYLFNFRDLIVRKIFKKKSQSRYMSKSKSMSKLN